MKVKKKPPRCDHCGRRIRPGHHELLLVDAATGQQVGHYHAPTCQYAATKYLKAGAVLRAIYRHPDRCGDNQERCDAGQMDGAA